MINLEQQIERLIEIGALERDPEIGKIVGSSGAAFALRAPQQRDRHSPIRRVDPGRVIVVTQAEHDAAHPGKVCPTCPVTVAMATLVALVDTFEQRMRRRDRVRVVFALVVLIGFWVLAGLVH